MRKMAKENIIVVCTIVLCFMLTLALCMTFSGEGILGVFNVGAGERQAVYAVACGGYSDMTLARASADMIKSRGGAGYVLKGDEIEIIYALYPSQDDAKNVVSSMGERGVYVKKIEIGKGSFKWCKGDLKDSVFAALKYFDIAFESMYKVANDLNADIISVEDAKTQIKVLRAQIEDIKCVFYQNTADCDKAQIGEIKVALTTALALIDNVDFAKSRAFVTSSIRYQLVQLTYCRKALMSNV